MRQKFSVFVISVMAGLLAAQSGWAQKVDIKSGQVVWKGMSLNDAVTISNNGGFIYLVQFNTTLSADNPEKYISSGGAYGVQGVLSSVGMRMQIEQIEQIEQKTSGRNTYYQVVTRVQNSGKQSHQGDRMGFDDTSDGKAIYLDRGTTPANNNYPNWNIQVSTLKKINIQYDGEQDAHTEDVTVWTFQSNNSTSYYAGISNGNLVTATQENAAKWVAVSEEDFKNAMANVTWGEVDLGVFVQDAEFGRDNKDSQQWKWGTWSGTTWNKNTDQTDSWTITGKNPHWHQRNQDKMCNGILVSNGISREKAGANVDGIQARSLNEDGFRYVCGKYYKAEIYNEATALSQKLKGFNIPNLTDGLYKLTAQVLYWDGENGTTNNDISYFVVMRETESDDGTKTTSIERLPTKPLNAQSGNGITTVSGVSAGYYMNTNPNDYLLEFFLEINGKTNITIGIEQKEAKGWTVIGNVHLYAHGKQALFIDEDWCAETSVPIVVNGTKEWSDGDPYQHTRFNDKYEYPATVYYNRTFTKDRFNPICLPIGLTGNQVRQAFGNDCQLSEFNGLGNNGKTLLFQKVDLDQNGIVMVAGKPYIVKVTTEPYVAAGESIALEVGNGGQNQTVTIDGPIYTLPGVTKETSSGLPNLQFVTKDGITFEGTFYFKGISTDELANNDFWLIRKGDMYHLDGTNPGYLWEYSSDRRQNEKTGKKGYMVWGTYAYLHAQKETIHNITSLAIQDISGITTEISEIIFDSQVATPEHSTGGIYTISGQKIGYCHSLENLRKGIYIVSGKKVVIR